MAERVITGNPVPHHLREGITAKERAEILRLQDKAIRVDTEFNTQNFRSRRQEILNRVRKRTGFGFPRTPPLPPAARPKKKR